MSLLRRLVGGGAGALDARKTSLHRLRGRFSGALGARCLLVAFTFALGGCATSAKSDSDSLSGGPGTEEPPDEETVEFIPGGPLSLAPSEITTLTVSVTPLRLQNITFELLSESNNFDGFILRSENRVREDGTATVEVQAPSSPSVFRVRASLSEGSVAVITVLVSSPGYGTIEVTPNYGGTRIIRQWTASAYVNETCDALSSYWEDGPLVATGASRATIENVSLGVPIALTLRGGPLVAGCTTLSSLTADHLEEVVVPVTDRPVDVRDGKMALSMGVTSSTTGFTSHLDAAINLAGLAFRGTLETDAAAVLELIASDLGSSQQSAFRESIETHDLTEAVRGVYGTTQPVSQAMRSLLLSAASKISGEDIIRGELELDGDASTLVLTEVAGADPTVAGFEVESTWLVGAEAPDIVVISGTLTYAPLKWLHAIATNSPGDGTHPAEALSTAARCDEVASAVLETAQEPPFGNCDESCLSDLCASSLASLWEALPAVEEPQASLQVGLSGAAQLYGAAHIESFEGSWVGRLGTEAETSIAGPASAQLLLED